MVADGFSMHPERSRYLPAPPSPGFTLVEIMIVVVIIGLLAAMALPAFQQVRASSQNARFYNDVRVFAAAAEAYMLETGVNPMSNESFGDPSSGTLNTAMQGYVKYNAFTVAATPIGGLYDFDNDWGFFGVGTDNATVGNAQLLKMDQDFDDGNLSTGQLLKPTGNRYYFIISR